MRLPVILLSWIVPQLGAPGVRREDRRRIPTLTLFGPAMRLEVNGRSVYTYTGTKPIVPGQRSVMFIHGAANDHSVWALQSRYFAYHSFNVLAVDLPGHGKSAGPVSSSVEEMAAWAL